MVVSRAAILARTSFFTNSVCCVSKAFWSNSSMHQSLFLTSAAISSCKALTRSSIAFLTFSNASSLTLVARAARRGECNLDAWAARSPAAWRRSPERCRRVCRRAGLKVRVKVSWASSPLRMARAFETASISAARVFCRASHSWSVIWHFSLSTIRNCSSAESAALVSSMSSLLCARRSSVSASSWVFLSTCAWPAWISACLAALRSS
mmetsp:Transcript_86153/g.244013  ORF Transcript_86153/g.244013 Transcript_86153/m.244013 type:complete len:208 (+) Transcript_86153:215-838(+)